MDIWNFEKSIKKLDRAMPPLGADFEQALHAKIMGAIEKDRPQKSLERILARLPGVGGLVAALVGVATAALVGWLQLSKISNEERLAVALAQNPEAYRNSLIDSETLNPGLLDSETRDKLNTMNDEDLKKLFEELQ